jgi:hypothetical protein
MPTLEDFRKVFLSLPALFESTNLKIRMHRIPSSLNLKLSHVTPRTFTFAFIVGKNFAFVFWWRNNLTARKQALINKRLVILI